MEKDILLMDPVQLDLYQLRQRAATSKDRRKAMEERKHVRGFGETRRKVAKQDLLKVLEQVGPTKGKRKALAIFSLRSGHSIRRAEEYLDELVEAELIQVVGDVVLIPGKKQSKEEQEP